MRISTSLKYDIGINQFNLLQNKQLNLFEQITAESRVVRPGDDPLAASQAVTISQNQSLNKRYEANRNVAERNLGFTEQAMKTSVNVLDAINTRLVQSGNGAYGADDLQAIASELRSSYAALVTQANATDGNGVYLFSGNQGDTAPFVADDQGWVDGAAYQGDGGDRKIQIDQTRQLATGFSGQDVFGYEDGEGYRSVFGDLQAVIGAMESYDAEDPDSVSDFQAALGRARQTVKGTFDNVSTQQAAVGARLNEISALDAIGSARDLSYSNQVNELVGLDTVSAYSMISYYRVALEASALSFQKIQALNLFNS